MKIFCRSIPIIFFISLILGCRSLGSGSSSAITLDEAIQIAAGDINTSLGESTVVAVINFSSSSENLSDYVIEELMGNLINEKKLVVVDRNNLDLVREEMDLHLSGEVSDESAQAIGRMLGAQGIITGSLVSLGRDYRFRVYTINVESAARETATLLTVRNDQLLSYLLRGADLIAQDPPPQGSPASADANRTAAPVRQRPVREIAGGLIMVESGVFTMGSPETEAGRAENEERHQVTISTFYLGKCEISQEEYEEVMEENPSYFKGAKLPVQGVNWYEAIEYCNRRSIREGLTPAYTRSGDLTIWDTRANGYRLPTEAEWEYACRAGTTGPFNTGDNISPNEANYDGNFPYTGTVRGMSRDTTVPVGSLPPNPWGFHGMHGNVNEWVWDWYAEYNTASQTDPQGPSRNDYDLKTLRGGGFTNRARDIRSAKRWAGGINVRLQTIGFRVARSGL
ncbi:MAG: SUMF1/EgtB/PvdO family nonheme iron enzyme [Treponema sp.]|nr:SUMF1/EgtB/PvdO family nonheme iron enzyme [Treponema sp.]